jgi:hypothetical protein
MKNNHSSISMSETATLLSHISDPIFSKQLEHLAPKGDIRIVLLDLSRTHDVELHQKLYNTTDFDVISEGEHSGRYSVFVVVRYRKTGTAELGPSSAEIYTRDHPQGENPKKRSKKKAKKGSKKAPARKARAKNTVGFAPR